MQDFLTAIGQNEILVKTIAPVFLLGFLIFVHELGHFLFAKLFRVGVEKFSFGFGPRIWGINRNGTEYRLSWIPLGGYVKMVGDDPFEETPPEILPDSFLHKPVWQRLLIVLAGPLFNLLLPILLFAGLYMSGAPEPTTWVGMVKYNSAAELAGISIGDRILAIGDQPVAFYEDLEEALSKVELGGQTEVTVSRDGQTRKVQVSLQVDEVPNQWGEAAERNVLGVAPSGAKPMVGIAGSDESPALKAGLQSGDIITAIDEKPVEWWYQLEEELGRVGGSAVSLQVERDGKRFDAELTRDDEFFEPLKGESQGVSAQQLSEVYPGAPFGLFPFELFVQTVIEGKPAAQAGFESGDMIYQINGSAVRHWSDIKGLIEAPAEETKNIVLLRKGQLLALAVKPEVLSHKGLHGKIRSEGRIGIGPGRYYATDLTTLRISPFSALARGAKETAGVAFASARILSRIFTGDIPLSESVGGPIAIVTMAARSAWQSIYQYFRFMALISVSLGIMNLLPIPILDGGHILFFALELIRGRPVSMKFREVSQQVGLILLFIIMAYAIVNDVRMSLFR